MMQPHTLIPPDEALRLVLQSVEPAAPRAAALLQCVGLRLASDVCADRDYPPFDRAMMDGYAVHREDLSGQRPLSVTGQLAAGQTTTLRVERGQTMEIMTGAACPDGTEAIVPREHAMQEGDWIRISGPVRGGQHVATRGSECRQGAVVLHAGAVLTPLAVGVLASVGLRDVPVIPAARVGILTTGGELIDGGQLPGAEQIRDSNGPMLAAMAISCGIPAPRLLHAADDLKSLMRAVEELSDSDMIILTGGVSMGRYDLVPECLHRLGAERIFHGVAQKPGKPLLFARRGRQLLFGLPGNPLAAHLGFHRYVVAALARWCGFGGDTRPRDSGRLQESVRADDARTRYVLSRATPAAAAQCGWHVRPLPGGSSADLFGTSAANCYLEVPPGGQTLEAGAQVCIDWLASGALSGSVPGWHPGHNPRADAPSA